MKKRISILVAVLTFFVMTAVSFAANTANINVTSEPIQYHALCDKAGGLTITFDDQTLFESGDQITADLPLNVSLCHSMDYMIGLGNPGTDPLAYDGGFTLPAIGTDGVGPLTGDGTLSVETGTGIVFHVHGVAGSQRIYIDILSDVSASGTMAVEMTGGVADSDLRFTALDTATTKQNKMALEILDQESYGCTIGSGMFSNYGATACGTGVDCYDDITTSNENTLCINVSQYDNEYVKLSWDSKDDKYTWIPSDPQVAHVVAATSIAFAPCAKQLCGNILGPDAGGQGEADSCLVINNEGGINATGTSYATSADGYCAGTHRNNRVIIQQTSGTPFPASNYQVQLEILVDGVGGDQGAYFDGGIGVAAFDTSAEACSYNSTAASQTTILYNANNESNVFQTDASGTNAALAFASNDVDCDIAAVNRIVKVKTVEATLVNGTTNDFLWFDIPNIVWDQSLFTLGEVLSVRITLLKAPCGTIFQDVWCIGTLGCGLTPGVCYEYSRIYPYFAKAGAYTNVLVITNPASSAVDFDLEIYEKDGDKYTAVAPVAANGIGVFLLHSLAVTADPSNAAGSVFGDTQCYVVSSGPNSGFFGSTFVTNGATGESFSGRSMEFGSSVVDCEE